MPRSEAGGARARGPPGPPGGFTLMEILVAMAVLSIALLTIYQSFAATVQVNGRTQGLWQAMLFVNNELARIERGPPLPVSIRQGDFPPEHPMAGYAWRREVSNEEPLPGVEVRKVVVEVTWEAAGVEQTYRDQVYVAP